MANENIILSIKDVHKSFPGVKALDNVSLDVRAGSVHGIVGENIFLGRFKEMGGKIVKIKKPAGAKRMGIGLVPEDRKLQGLVLPFSVQSNIAMASLDRLTRLGFINRSEEKAIALRQIKNLSIKTPSTLTKAVSLSGGNQQKCIMGRWLEINPSILILDEPTRGIDVGAKYEIYIFMKQIVENGGSIIMISSELPEVLNMGMLMKGVCQHLTDAHPVSSKT